MGAVLTRLLEIFWTKKLDIVVIGLENRYGNNSLTTRDDDACIWIVTMMNILKL
jgi:hypothetical protein